MQRIRYSLFVCFSLCTLAWQGAPAATGIAGQHASSSSTKGSKSGGEHNSSHAQRKAFRDKPAPPAAKPVAAHKTAEKSLAADQKTAAREQAEGVARANRLYQSSQFSAPIITDPTACRRTGANGESIYENC
jgi:hypothetical protein